MYVDKDTQKYCKNIKIVRNPKWPDLDFEKIDKEVEYHDDYEYKMAMNNCRTNEQAIKAIKNRRRLDKEYDDEMRDNMKHYYKEKKKNRYVRKKYNDIEDDLEDEYS